MALIWMDGFDNYTNGSTNYLANGQGTNDLSGTKSRTGVGAYVSTGPNGPYVSIAKRVTLTVGIAIAPPSPPAGLIFTLFANGVDNVNSVTQLQLALNTDGSITVLSFNVPFQASLGRTAPNLLFGNTYAYVELQATANQVTGSFTLRVNGATVLAKTNVNTDPAGVTGYDTVRIGGATSGLFTSFDDFYVFDSSGGANNTFAGAARIYTALPTSDSSPLQWTPSTGVTHFNLVNGVPAETQSTYVFDAGVGNTDQYLYNVSAIPATVQILGVQHGMDAFLDSAGSGSLGSSCGGVVAGSVALSTSPHIYSFQYDTDPVAAGAWTLAHLTVRPFGPNRTA